MRAMLLFGLGVAAAFAWTGALYASFALASLLGVWVGALALGAASRNASRAPIGPIAPVARPPADDALGRRRLIAYLDLTPAALVTLGEDGSLRAVNRAARRLFGTDDLVAHHALDDAVPGNGTGTLADMIGSTAPGRSATVRLESGDARRHFALATADLAAGGGAARIAVLVDIDAELRAAEAAALRDMLQILGHEIRNALTPIASLGRTAADMLGDAAPDLAEIRDAVATIARRAEGLQRFSRGYAELARLPAPVIGRVDPSEVVGDLARLFRTHWPDLRFRCDVTSAPSSLRADADQLIVALWALLQNAAEAVVGADSPAVALDVRRTRNGTAFAVSDTGPGVDVADREAIFRPFFTTKKTGSGIGLALARQVFLAHGGTLDLVRSPDGASSFVGVV